MNRIQKKPLKDLGYHFIDGAYLPNGKNEYYLRDQQRGNQLTYRKLNAQEIETLVRNDNTSDDWNNIFVADEFDPKLVQHCHFYGLVRIGKLEPYYLEYRNLRLPVGLYNSTIASCDFGDNIVIHNVNFLSHYIIGNEVILANINEMATTDYAKFGNGIVKDGEDEKLRIWLELCNENGNRSVMPFDGMLPGDAYLWTRHRDDQQIQQRFKEFTEKKFDKKRGYYGIVGDRSVIKHCNIIKDVAVGSDAYIKGANKLKNLTVNSSAQAPSQIGEGCELVNGIIGYGCRIFYGVKAVRFILASHSQLKYGARLINSFLGNNATISCCEVLNSLIFPAHEQHHNNSFLCAALIMGQSNMAAGATIGSNHNSRGADGEVIAGRGFWPGLSVSLKHNSIFPTFTLIAKGTYSHEMNIPFPFSLVINDEHENSLKIMAGYWFTYNMYALARNSWKYVDRDKRNDKMPVIEYDYLAPDSVEELMESLPIMASAVGKSYLLQQQLPLEGDFRKTGHDLLMNQPEIVAGLEVLLDNIENSHRKVKLLKAHKIYRFYHDLIVLYGVKNLVAHSEELGLSNWQSMLDFFADAHREAWVNVGGLLMPRSRMNKLTDNIKSGTIDSWDSVHEAYKLIGSDYKKEKLKHAWASMLEVAGYNLPDIDMKVLRQLFNRAIATQEIIAHRIYHSREKDYKNPFRLMSYDNVAEMEAVIGKLDDNTFINETITALETFKHESTQLLSRINF
ncbi:DUF4954 domain-containing protein [Chitinophaga caeni]|uniref:DUF4954 domain-containing protein n=1 Tax=Chitinophaga caeni TaxID=2029983 RepID=A0A291QZY6_9BACT|nr:DUF4954 family protein [Chitinophaga caeni]ATL49471.1 DUF4954 domain-containing protein [Chitinophaga caeni]